MKLNTKYTHVFACILGIGLLGFGLRWLLYRVGFDEKGILPAFHPLQLACLALAALAAGIAFPGSRQQPDSFQAAAAVRFAAGALAGILLCLHGLSLERRTGNGLDTARLIFCFLSATAMVVSAFPTLSGTRLETFCQGLICMDFALEMLCRYQGWSGNPQLPDYCFQVLACVCLTLSAYHRMALGVGLSKPYLSRFFSLVGLCLCLICTAGPETAGFYLCGVFWACTCAFAPEPPAAAPAEEAGDVSA